MADRIVSTVTRSLDPNAERFADVATPALVIDVAALERNIARMAQSARHAGLALRPHAKTHKSPDIARRQRDAGAIGIACATLSEAEDLAAAGFDELMITSPVVGREKAARLARLCRGGAVIAAVDHPAQVDGLLAGMTAGHRPLRLMVDVDIGQERTGVAKLDDGVALARRIGAEPRLRFVGLQGYAGHIQHIFDPGERRSAAERSGALVRALADRLRAEGLVPEIVSGSGTGASGFDLHGGPFTELQVGSYVFMEADYGRVREPGGARLPFENALYVLATVVSANRPGQVTVDAGTKALAVNGPPPDRFIGAPEGAAYAFTGDEHGALRVPQGAPLPALGARVLIGATHCDPTVNLHAGYVAAHPDGRLESWPIVGRYR